MTKGLKETKKSYRWTDHTSTRHPLLITAVHTVSKIRLFATALRRTQPMFMKILQFIRAPRIRNNRLGNAFSVIHQFTAYIKPMSRP